MSEEQSITLTASPELARRELRRLRRHGLRSPKDHIAAELIRSLLIIGPAILWFFEIIETAGLLAFICGYFFTRWYERFFKPHILRRFGPAEWRDPPSVQGEITFDSFGLRSIAPDQDIRLGWRTVPVSKVGDGMIFRIGSEMSMPVTSNILPDDWSMDRFEAAILHWKAQAQDE